MREDDFRNFQLRICSSLFDRIEDWRRSQPEIPVPRRGGTPVLRIPAPGATTLLLWPLCRQVAPTASRMY